MSTNFVVVVAGVPALAQALQASGQFAQVVPVGSTSQLRSVLTSRQLTQGVADKIFCFADNLPVDTPQTLGFLVEKLTGQMNARVVIIGTTPAARTLVAQCPGAGLLEGDLRLNTVLGAFAGLPGVAGLQPVADGANVQIALPGMEQTPSAFGVPAGPGTQSPPAGNPFMPSAPPQPVPAPWEATAAPAQPVAGAPAPTGAAPFGQPTQFEAAPPAAPQPPHPFATPAQETSSSFEPAAATAAPFETPAAGAAPQPGAPAHPSPFPTPPTAEPSSPFEAAQPPTTPAQTAGPFPPAGGAPFGQPAAFEAAPAEEARPLRRRTGAAPAPEQPAAQPGGFGAYDPTAGTAPDPFGAGQPSSPFGQQPTGQASFPAQGDFPPAGGGAPFGQQPAAQPDPFGQQPAAQPDPFGQPPVQGGFLPAGGAPFGQPPAGDPFAKQPMAQPDPFGQQPAAQGGSPFGGGAPVRPVARAGAVEVERPARLGRVITVTAPKGGTGKSTLSLNLAAYLGLRLRGTGRNVCIIDANVQQADTSKYLNAYKPNIEDILADVSAIHPDRINDYLLHRPNLNLSALLGPTTPDSANPIFFTGRRYTQILEALKPLYDYVIIDTPVAELYHEVFREFALPQADFICVTITPNVTTLLNTDAWLRQVCSPVTANGMGVSPDQVGIVLNRAEDGVGCSEEEVQRNLGEWRFLGSIPETKEWKRCNNLGELVATKNYHELNEAFAAVLAPATGEELLMTTAANLPASGGLSAAFKKLLGGKKKGN